MAKAKLNLQLNKIFKDKFTNDNGDVIEFLKYEISEGKFKGLSRSFCDQIEKEYTITLDDKILKPTATKKDPKGPKSIFIALWQEYAKANSNFVNDEEFFASTLTNKK